MDWPKIVTELTFRTSRSSGAGGQHVNKTETKVEVLFDVNASEGLTFDEKALVFQHLAHRISDEGILVYKSQKSRSQVENKETAVESLYRNLLKALTPVKRRVKTKPPASATEERLESKKHIAEKKEMRRKPKI